MSSKTGWRKMPSDTVSSHQDEALSTTIFLLRSYGPTAFLLKEDGERRNFKVCLGEQHTCTCQVFTREQQPCKHICWLLLKKFRLNREHQYAFQLGLSERQLYEVLQGVHQAKAHQTELSASASAGSHSLNFPDLEAGGVCRKVIHTNDVCPICQEELLQKKLPVSYCRFGCGNSIHIFCIKLWADHQKLSEGQEMVKCPLCRETFCSLQLLQELVKNAAKLFTAAERQKVDRHLGLFCCSCRVFPITGTCFKCTLCSSLYLCQNCVKKGCHSQHPLASRTTRNQRWIPMAVCSTKNPEPQNESTVIEPSADSVLEHVPAAKVRCGSQLLDEGLQCRICLERFSLGQWVRTLACHHKFHMDCVDQILLRSHSCPLDGYVIYSRRTTDRMTSPKLISTKQHKKDLRDLFVPGVALLTPSTKPTPASGAPNSVTNGYLSFNGLRQNSLTSPLRKVQDNVPTRPSREHLKDGDKVAVGDSRRGTLELKMTGVSINTKQ